MGAECSVANLQGKICGPDYDGNNMDNQAQQGNNNITETQQENESDNEFNMDAIVGYDNNGGYNEDIKSYNNSSAGKYKIDKNIDLSDLRKKLGRKLIRAEIVNDNQLQLMFSERGFSIDPTKCEMSKDGNGEYTLQVLDHSYDIGNYNEKNHLLKTTYTLPQGTKRIKCNY